MATECLKGGFRMNMIDLRRAVISSIVALVLTFVLFIVCSLLTALSVIPDSAVRTTTLIITTVCALIAGFLTSRNVYEYGLLNGMATGVIFFLALYILSIILTFSFSFNILLFKSFLTIIIASGTGGIIGINSRSKRRRTTYRRRYR